MNTNNQAQVTTASLIEELTDADLENYVGGLGVINPVVQAIPSNTSTLNVPGLLTQVLIQPIVPYSARYKSDRNLKEEVAEVDVHSILKGIAHLPISTWKYIDQDQTIRHIGPMAQDFAATFNVGESDTPKESLRDRTINVVDAHGVTLAAIQALYQVIQQQASQINELQTQLHQLKQQQQF